MVSTEELLATKERRDRYQNLAVNCSKFIRENCTCPPEHRESKENYCSGSYLDRATTTYYDQCNICGRQSNKRVETHSWYG